VGANTSAYHPLTLAHLRLLKEVAQPTLHPEDYDPDMTKIVVQKVLAIQSGRALSRLVEGSELRQTYRAAMTDIKALQNRFRYSLQSDGEGVAVSRQKLGRKLMELNLELNVRQGFDPQIHFGKDVRFRYDYLRQRAMLEYGFEF
jgi:hypothetical protein